MHIHCILKALPFKASDAVLSVARSAPMTAHAANTNYDMYRFFNQGHPFASQLAPVMAPASAQAVQP